jgi:hypothetical protein
MTATKSVFPIVQTQETPIHPMVALTLRFSQFLDSEALAEESEKSEFVFFGFIMSERF